MWNTFPSSYVSCLFNSIITVLYSIFKILIIFILIIFMLMLIFIFILIITISFLVDRKAINLTSTLPPMPAFPPFPTRNGDVVTMPTPS